jgi:ribonuclease D
MMRDKLGPILMNPNIVKLVFSDHDLRALQRDFGMFCRSVVDVQSLCRVNLQRAQPVGLKECAKLFLNVDMDKSLQRGEFMLRPLSQEMIKYASNDTKVLLRLWNKIKSDVNIDLSESIESRVAQYVLVVDKLTFETCPICPICQTIKSMTLKTNSMI